tara:strand:+ start:503 stop:1123 length:621 start_codon:yes stop_codon:yes gene_type:complete
MAGIGTAALVGGAIQGVAGIAGGIIGSRKRRREEKAAKREMAMAKAAYSQLDTSNLYAGMENTMEDLTVNQQQAQFEKQMQQQALATTMTGLQGAAGGSGIAALAQSLAGQQMQAAQQASATIGQQEQQNQLLQAQQAQRLQELEAQGAVQARALEYEKTGTLLGMSQQRLGAARQARAAATQSIIGGIGAIGGAVAGSNMFGGGQ